jgi:ABC-type phosphate/phosphonate transport system ATPase subunit
VVVLGRSGSGKSTMLRCINQVIDAPVHESTRTFIASIL